MRLVGPAQFGHVVDELVAGLAALVLLALVFLFLEDLPDREASSLPGAAPVGKLFEAPCGSLELSLTDQLECVEDVYLDALLVFQYEPGVVNFVVGVVCQVQNGSDHNDFVEGDGFLLLWGRLCLLCSASLLFVEGSDIDNLAEANGLSGSGRAIQRGRRRVVVAAAAAAIVVCLHLLRGFLLFR